ncbi:MAG: aconitase/3-isopropylmalate dehydratase large subunit family protein [Pseudomonadota bacterium]
MKPKTMIEKIIAKHTKDYNPDIVWMDIDVRSARDFGGPNVIKNYEAEYGETKLDDISKTFFTFDCCVPANSIQYANNQHKVRLFAKKNNIKLYDVDAGIGSHVMIDEQIAYPGSTVVGTDSHLNILGAIGAFGQGMGDVDIAYIFKSGKTWFQVPKSMRINITGKRPENVSAKDITLYVLKHLGSSGGLGLAIEFYGDVLDSFNLSERITLCSMVTEMAGIIGFIVPNQEIMNKFSNKKFNLNDIKAAADAEYVKELNIDISNLKPQMSLPGSPADVVDVASGDSVRIDSVFLGSCTNGRYEDIKSFAQIIKGHHVAESVMVKIVPSTAAVFSKILKEGIMNDLIDAGCIVSNPGCGGCASGQIGMTGEKEVALSTSNRNFKGKQGMGEIYLVSPETAAFSSLEGRICTK